jgi:CHAT domain-containing protein
MLHLVDSGAHLDSREQPIYSYAHPLFWAPFSLVGEGAGR